MKIVHAFHTNSIRSYNRNKFQNIEKFLVDLVRIYNHFFYVWKINSNTMKYLTGMQRILFLGRYYTNKKRTVTKVNILFIINSADLTYNAEELSFITNVKLKSHICLLASGSSVEWALSGRSRVICRPQTLLEPIRVRRRDSYSGNK